MSHLKSATYQAEEKRTVGEEIEIIGKGKLTMDPELVTKEKAALDIDPEEEKKLLLKVDLHLVPILFLLFLCAFIDR